MLIFCFNKIILITNSLKNWKININLFILLTFQFLKLMILSCIRKEYILKSYLDYFCIYFEKIDSKNDFCLRNHGNIIFKYFTNNIDSIFHSLVINYELKLFFISFESFDIFLIKHMQPTSRAVFEISY
jgi:hypothetical protein